MSVVLWTLVMILGSLMMSSEGQGYYSCDRPSGSGPVCRGNCSSVSPKVPRSLKQVFQERFLYVNFCAVSEENLQIDNICYSFFPVVGDPDVYIFYKSRVYKNGTNEVRTFLITQDTLGILKCASPACGTFNDTVIGQDQCGNYINYRCYSCEGCLHRIENEVECVFGLSRSSQPISPSCFQQSIQIIQQTTEIPPQRYFPLPMKLPHQCVTRRNCELPTCSS